METSLDHHRISRCCRVDVADEDDEELGSPSEADSGNSSATSSTMDIMDDVTSSSSSSSSNSPPSSSDRLADMSPLFEMSDLLSELPIRRGLSKHYQGKSRSFASLSGAICSEDLAKPQVITRPRKRGLLKSCRSYGGGMDGRKPLSPKGCKRSSKGMTLSHVTARRRSRSGARPLVHHPHSPGGVPSPSPSVRLIYKKDPVVGMDPIRQASPS